MFNWVCPRCGRENSPSYVECPDCKERDAQEQAEAQAQAQAEAHAQAAMAAPPQPVYPPQPPQTQEWQPQYQPPPQQPVYAQPPQQQYVQQPVYPPQQPQYAPPQYAPPQQYAQPPQYAPQQPPPQYAPPQQQPPQQQPPQQPQYAPQQTQYTQTHPIYVPQQQPPQYAPLQQQYVPPAPGPQAPAPVAQPKPTPKPAPVPPRTPAPPEPEQGFFAKLGSLPTPLLMLLFAVLFLVIGAGGYFGYQRFAKPGAGFSGGEPAATATKQAKSTNPIAKFIEVVGIRLTTDAKKKPIAKFVVVNHASTSMAGLSANVTLWASTSRSEEDSVGSFTFHIDDLGAYDSKELSAPFKTKLKMYELPDWQNATAEIEITSPQP